MPFVCSGRQFHILAIQIPLSSEWWILMKLTYIKSLEGNLDLRQSTNKERKKERTLHFHNLSGIKLGNYLALWQNTLSMQCQS